MNMVVHEPTIKKPTNPGRFNKLHTEAIRRASLKYCELDTLSMVRIWEYFRISTK